MSLLDNALKNDLDRCDFMNEEITRLNDELSEYKNIEEELGISLVTLINVLKNGFYCYCAGTCLDYVPADDVEIDIKNKRFNYLNYFKDYGRTWALTKEELVGNGGLL